MSNKKQPNWIYNPWVLTLIAYLILTPIGSWIYDHTKNIPIITPISRILKDVFNFKIALWLTILLLLISYVIYKLIKNSNVQIAKTEVLPFLDYTSDRFKSWKWRWEYQLYGKEFSIENLTPVCEKCDIKTLSSSSGFYRCPMCNDNFISQYSHEYENNIRALIGDRINKRNLHIPVQV